MAHPVRPDSYVEINNFYTATVYEKGAEVVRMMQTLVGRDGFARGMTLYFERHDGQAVTCDDFAQAIADANPAASWRARLPQFKRWYCAGRHAARDRARPLRRAVAHLHARPRAERRRRRRASRDKQPFVIPLAMGLVGRDGRALPLQLEDEPEAGAATERVLVLDERARRSSPSSTSTPSRCRRCCAASRRR